MIQFLLLSLLGATGAHPAHLAHFYFKFDSVPVQNRQCVKHKIEIQQQQETNVLDFNLAGAHCTPHRLQDLDLVLTTNGPKTLTAHLCAMANIGLLDSWFVPLDYHCVIPYQTEETRWVTSTEDTLVINFQNQTDSFRKAEQAYLEIDDDAGILRVYLQTCGHILQFKSRNKIALEELRQDICRHLGDDRLVASVYA